MLPRGRRRRRGSHPVRKLIDCHIHTERCGHATGTVDDCARSAVAQGLYGIALTEHLALPDEFDPRPRPLDARRDLDEYLVRGRTWRAARYPGTQSSRAWRRTTFLAAKRRPAAAFATASTPPLGRCDLRAWERALHRDWAFDDPSHVEEWEDRRRRPRLGASTSPCGCRRPRAGCST